MNVSVRNPTIAMPLLIVVVGIPLIIWGERFPIGGGWGYDGQNYGKWATDFSKWIFGKKMEAYYISKCLPSAIIHYTMRLFDVELTRMSVIRAFQIYNLIVLALAAFTWARVAHRIRLGEIATWFGFLALFVNFPFLKAGLYNPLTINPSGLLLGMAMFYAFLARKQILLVVIGCLGAYTWPTVLATGMILFVFPRRDSEAGAEAKPAPYGLNELAGLLAAIAALLLVDYFWFDRSYEVFNNAYARHVSASFVYLSTACALVFLFFSVSRLLDRRAVYLPSTYITRETALGVAIRLVIAITLYKAAQYSYSYLGPRGPGPTLEFYYAQLIFGAIIRPLQFLVAHVVLFGPVIVFIVLRWKQICERVHTMGPGLVLFMLTLLLQAITSQGRQLIPYMPFVVGLTALVWKDDLPRLKLTVFAALCFLYSKIWFPISAVKLQGNPREWPLQRFFMNHGPWMNVTMYVVQGAFVLLTFLFIYFTFRDPDVRTPAEPREAVAEPG
jgi:hypothetical protein